MDATYYKKYEPFFGSWHITDNIGEGSYGTVFRIERAEYGITEKAAMKAITIPRNQSELRTILSEGQSEAEAAGYFRGFVEELVKEFALMAQMKGQSNIVSYEDHQVIEHTDDVGWDIFIRMELLTPLDDYIQQHSFSEQEAIKLGIDLCKALEICQKHKIIHRDVKPENIFVSDNGDYKLGDFGTVRIVERTTGASTKAGSAPYMAPEVYKGQRYSSNVDIYSLGLVLFRLVNRNRPPFFPPAPQPITYKQREEAFLKRVSGADIPRPVDAGPRLAEIICKACAYDPEKRYESPTDMRRQLEAILLDGSETKTDAHSNEILPYSQPVDESFDVFLMAPPDESFAQNCGTKFDESEPFIDLLQLYNRRKELASKGQQTIACTYCGELNPTSYLTCFYCGNLLWNDVDFAMEESENMENTETWEDYEDGKPRFWNPIENKFAFYCTIILMIGGAILINMYLWGLPY